VVFTVAAALLFENPPVHQPPSHEHANGIQQPLLSQVMADIGYKESLLAYCSAANSSSMQDHNVGFQEWQPTRLQERLIAVSMSCTSVQRLHAAPQAENGEAAAADGSGGTEVKKEKKRGFTRSDSFKAAFGPTMVGNAVNPDGSLLICS
jgi:hypothetical protein